MYLEVERGRAAAALQRLNKRLHSGSLESNSQPSQMQRCGAVNGEPATREKHRQSSRSILFGGGVAMIAHSLTYTAIQVGRPALTRRT